MSPHVCLLPRTESGCQVVVPERDLLCSLSDLLAPSLLGPSLEGGLAPDLRLFFFDVPEEGFGDSDALTLGGGVGAAVEGAIGGYDIVVRGDRIPLFVESNRGTETGNSFTGNAPKASAPAPSFTRRRCAAAVRF